MRAKFYLFLFILLAGLHPVFAQDLNVSGTVTDENGEPLIGASVLVKGTKKGQMTDLEGRFHLTDLKHSDVLVISYVGMKKAEVGVKSRMVVKLFPEAEQLDEVIVTAFGTAKKSAFTGSATVIGSEQIEQKQVTNVMSSLIGEVPGLQIAPTTSPGSASSILIRGEGSINASNEPLIVLDGMAYDGEWASINPQDVESITVLKDAASNALYGARGANGVIMITTKSGQKGKSVITLDAKWGFNQRSTPDYDRIDNPGQYYELYYKGLYNYSVSQGNTPEAAHRYANETLFQPFEKGGLAYNVYTIPENEYLIGTNGRLNPNATLGRRIYKDGQVYTLYPDDWTDEAYRTGFRHEYNLSISGGTDAAKIYASLSYMNDEGIVDASDFERISGRLRATYQAKPWMLLGANVGITHSVRNVAYDGSGIDGDVFSVVANMAPIYPLYVRDRNGNIMYDSNGKMYDWGNALYNDNVRPVDANYNTLNALQLDYNGSSLNAVNSDAYMEISFLKDFKFTMKGGVSQSELRSTVGSNPYYGSLATIGGKMSKSHSRRMTVNLQQLLNWSHSYGHHNVSAMVGHEFYKYQYQYLSAAKSGAVNYEHNLELDGYLLSPYIPSSYENNYNREGFFFRGMYDYDQRYFGQVSFRRDASSRFHPDNRWGNFWSIGGAWIVSKEEWFDLDWVDNLKVKASYGEQGNDQIGSYRYVDTYSINSVNDEVSLMFNLKGNKDISWETSKNFNAGFEFDLFKNRLSGSIEYYRKITGDMLYRFTVPETLGYTSYWKNIGDMRNQGLEVMLSGTPVRTRKVEWRLSGNLTFEKQAVTYIADENKSLTTNEGYQGFMRDNGFVGEGLPLASWYIPRYAGVSEEGRSQWYYTDKNGELKKTEEYTKADYYIIDGTRSVYGGFGTSLKVGGFDLSAQFTYSIGGKGYDLEYAALMTNPQTSYGGYAIHKDMLNAWSPENTSSNIPRWQYGDQYVGFTSDRFLIDDSYLAFQNFQIGYLLPKHWVSKAGISKLRVYVAGDNLYLWSKRKGYDPRVNSGAYGTYSPMRTISLGINLQF